MLDKQFLISLLNKYHYSSLIISAVLPKLPPVNMDRNAFSAWLIPSNVVYRDFILPSAISLGIVIEKLITCWKMSLSWNMNPWILMRRRKISDVFVIPYRSSGGLLY